MNDKIKNFKITNQMEEVTRKQIKIKYYYRVHRYRQGGDKIFAFKVLSSFMFEVWGVGGN